MIEFIDFTKPAFIDDLFSFWENEYCEWDDLIKRRSGQLAVEQMQRYDKVKMIHLNAGKLNEWITDMNTLNPVILSGENFSLMVKEIERMLTNVPGCKDFQYTYYFTKLNLRTPEQTLKVNIKASSYCMSIA